MTVAGQAGTQVHKHPIRRTRSACLLTTGQGYHSKRSCYRGPQAPKPGAGSASALLPPRFLALPQSPRKRGGPLILPEPEHVQTSPQQKPPHVPSRASHLGTWCCLERRAEGVRRRGIQCPSCRCYRSEGRASNSHCFSCLKPPELSAATP